MNDNVLYYPAINLPKNEWTIKSLLYWDEVGVIMPYEFIKNPKNLTPQMREMVASNIVKQYIVEEYSKEQQKVAIAIEKEINSENFNLLKRQNSFNKGNVWKIHRQKFFGDLFYLLIKLNLADKIPDQINWFFVEAKTAGIMMTHLATIISRIEGSTPATDQKKFIPKNKTSKTNHSIDKIRSQILENVMPYPTNADLKSLLNFKDKHYDQLKEFRRYIESTCIFIASLKGKELKERQLKIALETIDDRKKELLAILHENKFKRITLGTIKSIVLDSGFSALMGEVFTPALTAYNGVNKIISEYNGDIIKDEDLAYIALMDYKIMK